MLCVEPVPVVQETAQATSVPYPVQQFQPMPHPASHATVVTQGKLSFLVPCNSKLENSYDFWFLFCS